MRMLNLCLVCLFAFQWLNIIILLLRENSKIVLHNFRLQTTQRIPTGATISAIIQLDIYDVRIASFVRTM